MDDSTYIYNNLSKFPEEDIRKILKDFIEKEEYKEFIIEKLEIGTYIFIDKFSKEDLKKIKENMEKI